MRRSDARGRVRQRHWRATVRADCSASRNGQRRGRTIATLNQTCTEELTQRSAAARMVRCGAVQTIDAAIARNGRDAGAHALRGDVLCNLARHAECAAAYQAALKLDAQSTDALAGLWHVREDLCEWDAREPLWARLVAATERALATKTPSPISPYHGRCNIRQQQQTTRCNIRQQQQATRCNIRQQQHTTNMQHHVTQRAAHSANATWNH